MILACVDREMPETFEQFIRAAGLDPETLSMASEPTLQEMMDEFCYYSALAQ